MEFLKHYFLCDHRMNRKPYILITILSAFLFNLPLQIMMQRAMPEKIESIKHVSEQKAQGAISIFTEAYNKEVNKIPKWFLLVSFAYALLLLPLSIMRLKDLDYPLRLSLLSLISPAADVITHLRGTTMPLALNVVILIPVIILSFFLTFKRGTKGPNKYGPDPLEEKAA